MFTGTLLFAILMMVVRADFGLMFILYGGMFAAQFFLSDKFVLMSMKARIAGEENMPELHSMIKRSIRVAGIPKPRVAISDSLVPNAFCRWS